MPPNGASAGPSVVARRETRTDQALFGIVQGGLDAELRVSGARRMAKLDFPGYAVGGLSVGESPEEMYRVLDATAPRTGRSTALPDGRWAAARFARSHPSRHRSVRLRLADAQCRNALAFTDAGPVRLRNVQHASDRRPLEPDCPCPACRHSRGYLRHLFMVNEMLGPILVSAHNLTFYQRLLSDSRAAIRPGQFAEFAQQKLNRWQAAAGPNREEP